MKILVPVKRVADPDNANKMKVSADGSKVTSEPVMMRTRFCGGSPEQLGQLSFTAAPTLGGTYQAIQRNGADLSVTVAQGKYISLTAGDFIGVQFLKIVSGSNEAATRTLTLAVRPV